MLRQVWRPGDISTQSSFDWYMVNVAARKGLLQQQRRIGVDNNNYTPFAIINSRRHRVLLLLIRQNFQLKTELLSNFEMRRTAEA
jgi:hypothetical protein